MLLETKAEMCLASRFRKAATSLLCTATYVRIKVLDVSDSQANMTFLIPLQSQMARHKHSASREKVVYAVGCTHGTPPHCRLFGDCGDTEPTAQCSSLRITHERGDPQA